MSAISGWGHAPVIDADELRSEDLVRATQGAPLSRGLGRSYGDSSLPAPGDGAVVNTVLADRLLAFDPASGLLRAEAGFSLEQLYRLFLPRGWFTPVSPGTQFVTLGGAVAADVHGKNHHRDGCIGRHVTRLRMRVADGRILECSPTEHHDLYRATIGGMGLTGHILEVELRLARVPSPWIWSESERVGDIDAFVAALKAAAPIWPQTVGWIDCLARGRSMGRGILIKGRWATPDEAPAAPPVPARRVRVPIDLPSGVLNPLTARAFNAIFYRLPQAHGILHPERYFYPLDRLRDWYRLYGKKGMTQYQCVLPESAGPGAARRFLEVLVARGGASPLCVIKDCGAEGNGVLSFPRPGISIAVDIPVRAHTQELVDALNEQVIAEGGRIYLAKDTFTRAEHFRRMEPRLAAFQEIRRRWDPERKLRSAQSVRLMGD
jgi:FAD/FMN-containing dehydrogenase